MMPEPKLDLAAALTQSLDFLHNALAGVTEEEAERKPDPLQWSIRDCVEHLALAERGMLHRIVSAEPGEPLPNGPERKFRIAASLGDRSNRLEAPRHVQPTGRFGTLAQSLEQFDAARREAILFAQERGHEVAARTVQHPLFGSITGAEMMIVMAGHARRHAEQIHQLRTAG